MSRFRYLKQLDGQRRALEQYKKRKIMERCSLVIRLLGKMEVLREEKPLPLPRSRKARALLAYLVATASPHTRSHLCDLLW